MAGQVVLMKMAMGRHPAVDVGVKASVLHEACKHYFSKNDAIAYLIGAGLVANSIDPTNAIYIADLEDDESFFSLLLVRGDPNRAIPAFVNPRSRVVVQSKPNDPGFVPGASCHLVISKQEIGSGTDQGRFRVVMQQTRGIGRTLVKDFLTHLLRRFAEEHPDLFIAEKRRKKKQEKPETVSYRPTVRFLPQMNGNLKKDLEEGKIGGFKLTRGVTKFVGEADEPTMQRLDVQLHARIAPTSDFSKVRRLIDHVRQDLGTISFESLNVELVDQEGRHLDSVRTAIEVDDLDDADMRYCRTLAIPEGAEPPMECCSKFNDPTKKFAFKCIQKNEHWK